jgi:hypothetical protein
LNQPTIPNGYILLSRKLLESEIMAKPPLYLKVWIYLLTNAQHKEYKGLKRGQLFTSIPEIQEAMSYMVGYRKETPSYKQIRSVLDWLRFPYEGTTKDERRESMIGTTKGTHGILVTIVNYDLYQDPKNYEGHSEGHDEGITKYERGARQGHNINKNDKNDKNEKTYSGQAHELLNYWNKQEIVVHKETDTTLKQIQKGLNKLPFDEIKKAIDRYVTIYRDPDYFYKHKWTLPKFLNQSNGAPDFLNEGIRWVNYQQQAQQKTAKESPRRHRELYLPEESK